MSDDNNTHSRLLELDAAINVVLGLALLAFPRTTVGFFGLPPIDTTFYLTILGAVLTGVGLALWMERRSAGGLGIPGAIAINLLGGGTVLAWLLVDPFELPWRGYVTLWVVAVAVLGTALLELLVLLRGREG